MLESRPYERQPSDVPLEAISEESRDVKSREASVDQKLPLADQTPWQYKSDGSQLTLEPRQQNTSHFSRYLTRSLLNIFGPAILVAFYSAIVVGYLLRPAVNGISPRRPISPRGLFYAWTLIGIFLVDWAKTGAAGLEAALLMNSRLAPRTAKQLMWHADRGWGSVNGWARALLSLHGHKLEGLSDRPSMLWWYLCASSLLFFAAVPLAGLSIDSRETLKLSNRTIQLSGSNQSTFDFRITSTVASQANSRWRQGNPTTPESAAILYASENAVNASATYYEDAIQSVYVQDTQNVTALDRGITFFAGPVPSERAHGSAWGLQVSVACSPANPRTGLKNMYVNGLEDWSGTPIYGTNLSSYFAAANNYSGTSPLFMFFDTASRITYKYFLANDRGFRLSPDSDYSDSTNLPIKGSLELVMWQSEPNGPDDSWVNITKSPYVMSSVSHAEDDEEYLGYGIRCEVSSDVGTANLDAIARTFSNFRTVAADLGNSTYHNGILAIQSIVFSALSTAAINNVNSYGPSQCQALMSSSAGGANGCSVWHGANFATDGAVKVQSSLSIYESITPERMNLAMYKIFGEVAIAMMTGPQNWEADMRGLDQMTDIVPGIVPWALPLALLIIWALTVVVPSVWTFEERRIASTIGGFEMFRLGAEWKEATVNRQAAIESQVLMTHNDQGPEITIDQAPTTTTRDTDYIHTNYRPLGREDEEIHFFPESDLLR